MENVASRVFTPGGHFVGQVGTTLDGTYIAVPKEHLADAFRNHLMATGQLSSADKFHKHPPGPLYKYYIAIRKIHWVILNTGSSAFRPRLLDTLLDAANSDLLTERLFAVKHKDTPLAQVVMMLGDSSPEVREVAEIIVEANKK